MSYLLEVKKFSPISLPLEETLFHAANGYLGIRGCFEENCDSVYRGIRGAYINGFYDNYHIEHPEKLFGFPEIGEQILNVTDVQGIHTRINGKALVLNSQNVSDYHRCLDMRAGQTFRGFIWSSSEGVSAHVELRRLVSFQRPEVFAIQYSLTMLNPAVVEIESTVRGDVSNFYDSSDPRVSGQAFNSFKVIDSHIKNERFTMVSRTAATNLVLRVQVDHSIQKDSGSLDGPVPMEEGSLLTLRWKTAMEKGETLVLEKTAVYRDSWRHGQLSDWGGDYWDEGVPPTYSLLAAEQRVYLDSFWERSDIDIVNVNADDEQLISLRFNMYNLLQSGMGSSGIPAKGLSGEGYQGHCFWDTEIYTMPFFLYTRPQAARKLLEYRYHALPEARNNARILGHSRGAAYPWRTISGRECSVHYPSGSAQYHINADIAYAVWRYWEGTSDEAFLKEYGAEILFETARIWIELGNFASDGFHINGITGPDEYTCMVNDNYYTNRMAAMNLNKAIWVYDLMKKKHAEALEALSTRINLESHERRGWEEASTAMVVPYDAKRDINPQDESFLRKPLWDFEQTPRSRYPLFLHYHPMTLSRYQVCKQADTILAYVLLDSGEFDSTVRNTFSYYEGITVHDSSLSYSTFSIVAAGLGEVEKAYEYFLKTLTLDLKDAKGNTKDGIHVANMGGTWMAVVWGFGGFRPAGDIPSFSPSLPSEWRSLRFRLLYRGAFMEIFCDQEQLRISSLNGLATDIMVWDSLLRLEVDQPLIVQMRRSR